MYFIYLFIFIFFFIYLLLLFFFFFFCAHHKFKSTQMDAKNLAIVFAPNLLRSNEQTLPPRNTSITVRKRGKKIYSFALIDISIDVR